MKTIVCFYWKGCLTWMVALSVFCGKATYGQDTTLAAFDLADNTELAPIEDKKQNMMLEAAGILKNSGDNRESEKIQRISFDMRLESPSISRWSFIVANRFDSRFTPGVRSDSSTNSLKEAYATYQMTPHSLLDIGRVNTRYGVAFGFNPTDYLGQGTVRYASSTDPEALRNNRLGNAMLRWQYFWDKGSLTAVHSPKLSADRSSNSTSLDWGASNPARHILLVGSYKFTENFNPQFLLQQEQNHFPQVGLNISHVLSNSTLFYTEWSAGRQIEQMRPRNSGRWQVSMPTQQKSMGWRSRIATGLTWTGENRLMLRAEGNYDGNVSQQNSLLTYTNIDTDEQKQVLSPRTGILLQAYWKDIVNNYDVNAIWRHELDQQRRNMSFVELRRHLGPVDVALQWNYQDKASVSEASESERSWQLSLSHYF